MSMLIAKVKDFMHDQLMGKIVVKFVIMETVAIVSFVYFDLRITKRKSLSLG